ncbi:class I SAM-dependent methyltransferase [Mycolicibacterium sp.]|uniref:class I SAM-dependent methyltransferase n=1 Tax=Mycolicibacterium sp. TaxID=2320850 RepID=UPI003D14452C
MSSPSLWSAGRYDAVGQRIAHIADQILDAVEARRALRGAALIDLACGTGNAALGAAARGARVTGVDITPELIAIATERDGDHLVRWRVGDAADTALPTSSFQAAVSNMGIVFVDPDRQVAEINRLLEPGGVLAFSAWSRDASNPLFDPVVAVLGAPARAGFSPDEWGDADIVTERLAPHYDAIDVRPGLHRWEFESMPAALHWLRAESPVHVTTFQRADDAQRERLVSEFESALRPYVGASGEVAFTSSFVIVSAVRR